MRDYARAQRVIDFIERLKITIGDDAGKAFRLRDWQKKFVRDVYSRTTEEGNRATRRAVLSIARKNGKTELAAALVLVHLIGPEAELNGEIYSAANDREQASIVFNAVKRMIEASPALSARLAITGSTKTIHVKGSGLKSAGSRFRALSADAGTKHGLNPSFVVYDELAQAKSRELLDTLLTSQGARKEPLFLTISTQNNDPTHPLSEMIDDGISGDDPTVCCHLYAAQDDCELLDEEQWRAANPALGDFRSYDELKAMAERAVRLPSEENAFRLLYLNQRVSLHSPLIAQSDWKKLRSDFGFVDGEPILLGLDMSMTTDLTALVAVSVNDGSRVKAWFWKPAELIAEHGKRDRQPYEVWAKDGTLIAAPGRVINPRLIAAKVIALSKQYDLRGLAFDRNRMAEVLRQFDDEQALAQDGEGAGIRCVPWGQGFVGFAPAVNALEAAVLSGELKHDGNPLLTSNMTNALSVMDPAGNRKLDKSASRFRIDGAVALAMALGLKALDRPTIQPTNPWEDPNFNFMAL